MAEGGIKKPRKPKESEFGDDIPAYVDAMLDYKEKKMEYRKMKYGDDSGAGPSNANPHAVVAYQQGTSEEYYKKFYFENCTKVRDYESIVFYLTHFLTDHFRHVKVNQEIPTFELVEMVKEVISEYQTKFNRFNLELKELSGHEAAGYIKDHHRKVMEVIEQYEEKIKAAEEEVNELRVHIAHMDAELYGALTKIRYLEKGTLYTGGFEDSQSEEQFMADLQSRVAHSTSLNSSMVGELQRQQDENRALQEQLGFLARQRVETEEKCMQEIVDFSRRSELNARLESALESMIKEDKEPNSEACQNIIDRWKEEINRAIDENSKEIDELFKRHERQDKEFAELGSQAIQREEELEKLRNEIKHSKSLCENYTTEIFNLRKINIELKHDFEQLEIEYLQRERENASFYSRDESESSGDFPTYGETPPRPHPSHQAPETQSNQWMESSPYPLSSTFRDQSRGAYRPTLDLPSIRFPTPDSRSPQRPESVSPTVTEIMENLSSFDRTPTSPPQDREPQIRPPSPDFRTPQRPESVSPTVTELMETLSSFDRTPTSPPPLRSRGMNRDQQLPDFAQAPYSLRSNIEQWMESSQRASPFPLPTRTGAPGGMPLSTPRAGRPGSRLGMKPVTLMETTSRRQGMRPVETRAGTPPRQGIPVQQPGPPRVGESQRSRIQRPRTGASQRSAIPTWRSASSGPEASERTGIDAPPSTGPKTRTPQRSGMRPADATPVRRLGARGRNLDQEQQWLSSRVVNVDRLFTDPSQAQEFSSRNMHSAVEREPLYRRVVLLSPIQEESLPLDVDVTAQDIIPSNDGEQFIAQVAIGVHEVTPRREAQNASRARQPRSFTDELTPTLTPRSGPIAVGVHGVTPRREAQNASRARQPRSFTDELTPTLTPRSGFSR